MNPMPFHVVLETAKFLAELPKPWFVAGGWAIDLYLNRSLRNHKDVDISVFRHDQLVIQEYFNERGWQLRKYVGNSVELEPWLTGEQLELPDRGIRAERSYQHSTTIDILLSETNGKQWLFHQDSRITHPIETISVYSALGVPILCPEIVLLFKARHLYATDPESLLHREADESDFLAIQGSITLAQRNWLVT